MIERHGAFSEVSFRRNKGMEKGCKGIPPCLSINSIELIERHGGAFSEVSFRRNKGMDEVGYGKVDRETWGILSSGF